MKIEFSDAELIALNKALRFVKFVSSDYDAKELAGSPHIGEIYKRVTEATHEYYKSIDIPQPHDWPFIENVRTNYLDIVRVHLRHTDNWNELQPDLRELFIKTLIYPYKVTEATIQQLVQYGNEVHN